MNPLKLLLAVWPPMLATASDEVTLAAPRGWVFEPKYDGFRALAALSGGKVSLQSRNGLDFSVRFPSIAKALASVVVPEAVLDGEIVALDGAGVARFQELQQSEGNRVVVRKPRLRYVVFDLLWLDGEDVRSRPLEDRRDLLVSVLSNVNAPIVLAERIDAPDAKALGAALADARARGTEGLIAKKRGSRYAGERGRDWRKLKVHAVQEFAVVGFSPISNGQEAIGALHLAVREGGAFRWAGKVGTGFTDKRRRELWQTLSADRVAHSVAGGVPRLRDAVWVTPRLVAQVEFTEWTADGKVRHPSFKGLREDKTPEQCVREPAPTAREASASSSAPD